MVGNDESHLIYLNLKKFICQQIHRPNTINQSSNSYKTVIKKIGLGQQFIDPATQHGPFVLTELG